MVYLNPCDIGVLHRRNSAYLHKGISPYVGVSIAYISQMWGIIKNTPIHFWIVIFTATIYRH